MSNKRVQAQTYCLYMRHILIDIEHTMDCCCHSNIQLPRVCSFQELEYHVILRRVDTNELIGITSTSRQQYGENSKVTVMFDDGLALQATYNATAVFHTFAENDVAISKPVQISKIFCKWAFGLVCELISSLLTCSRN